MIKQLTARTVISVLFLFYAFGMQAKQEIYPGTVLSGPALTGGISTAEIPPLPSGNDIYAQEIQNAVIFSLDHEKAKENNIDFPFEATVEFTLEADGESSSKALTIKYDPAKGKLSTDRNTYLFSGASRVKVTVQSLTGANSAPLSSQITALLRLENIIYARTMYKLTSVPMMNAPVLLPQSDEYEITWDEVEGAQEYQLEWMHVNKYENTPLPYSFKNNATRISTRDNSYKISSVFEEGFILLRVRAITYSDIKGKQIVEGAWSCRDACQGTTAGLSATTTGGVPLAVIEITPAQVHAQDRLNWQYTASYAEGGKKKEAVAYSDGTLRSRQGVTRINTGNDIIVAETFYDRQGRPALQTLPVPAGIQNRALRFHPAFNKSINYPGSSYSREDFDPQPLAGSSPACQRDAGRMSLESGASRYYSPQNEYLAQDDPLSGFIPDAQGYPFAHTQYEPDNTGRIRRQGGVGETYQLGNNHETKYSYLIPNQRELDRLFASEIGYNSHYRKNIARDANGQLSISYLDLQGRVRATALAGKAPAGLESLESNQPERTTVNIIDKGEIGTNPARLEFQYPYLVTNEEDDHNFNYRLEGIRFAPNGEDPQDLCLDCIYNLTLDIVDECGERPAIDGGIELPITEKIGKLTDACASSQRIFSTSFTIARGEMKVGATYTLTRVLSLDRDAITEQTDKYIRQAADKTLADFIQAEMDGINWDDCLELSCEQACRSSYSTSQEIEECIFECNFPNSCQSTQEIMNSDYRPGMALGETEVELTNLNEKGRSAGGQYAIYRIDDNGNYSSDDPTSIFHSSKKGDLFDALGNDLIDEAGNTIKPDDELYIKKIVDNFQDTWAEKLAEKLHPEKCKLEQCKQNMESQKYDNFMLATQTYEEAFLAGLLNPLALAGVSNIPLNNNGRKDPFFAQNNAAKSEMAQIMINEALDSNEGSINVNLWQKAALMAEICEGMPINECIAYYQNYRFDLLTQDNFCDRDRIWLFFRALYLAKKNIVVEKFQQEQNPDCKNDHIGDGKESNDYAQKTKRFPSVAELTQENEIDSDNIGQYQQNAMEKIEERCENSSIAIVDKCMEEIEGCPLLMDNFPANQIWDRENPIYDNLAAAFVEIMTKSCIHHNTVRVEGEEFFPSLYGFSSLPPGVFPNAPYQNFKEAMAGILGIGESRMDEFCNPGLITFPMPYGYVNLSALEVRVMDECACEKLIQRHTEFQSLNPQSWPQGVSNAMQYFGYKEGIEIQNYTGKICLCQKALDMASSQEKKNMLAASNEYISSELTCDVCIDCRQMEEAIRAMNEVEWFRQQADIYPKMAEPIQEWGYLMEKMISNHLNENFNRNLSYFEYREFVKNCETLKKQNGFVCDKLTPQASHLLKFLNGIVRKWTIRDNRICLTKELAWEWRNAIYQQNNTDCMDFVYEAEPVQITGLNILKAKISNSSHSLSCDLELSFMDQQPGYDFKNIISFEGIAPDTQNHDNRSFILTVRIALNDRVETLRIKGSTSCVAVAACYDSSQEGLYLLCAKPVPVPVIPKCETILTNMAIDNGQMLYDEYINSLTQRVRTSYMRQCLANIEGEEYNMTYTNGEHHYTLYYYDQAGNLVRTIPPQGVEFVPDDLLPQVARDRMNGTHTVFTKHRMETRYLYNSLDQLVAQYMPDHDPFENIQTLAKEGLDPALNIASVQMGSDGTGVLFGTLPQSPYQSQGYITHDGGVTWEKVSGLGLNDLNDVCVTQNYVFAAGNKGTLLKKRGDADLWTVVNTNTTDDLKAIHMFSDQKGYIFGTTGNIYQTSDEGDSWSLVPNTGLALTRLESLFFENDNRAYAVGYNSYGGMVYASEDGGRSWSRQVIATKGLTQVQMLSASLAYACDVNGLLIKSTDGGRNWIPVPSAAHIKWEKILFASQDKMVGITTAGEIMFSFNAGLSWTKEPLPNGQAVASMAINDGFIYALTRNGALYNTGRNSYSSWTLVNSRIDYGTVFEAVYFEDTRNGYALAENGRLYFSSDGGSSWRGVNTANIASENVSSLYAYSQNGLGLTHLTAITNDGKLFEATMDRAGSIIIPPVVFNRELTQVTVKDADFALSGEKYILSSTGEIRFRRDGGATWQVKGSMPGANAIALSPANPARGLAVDAAGRVHYSDNGFDSFSGATIFAQPLYNVQGQAQTIAAAGDKGTLLLYDQSALQWVISPTPFIDDLRTLVIPEVNHITAGARSGLIYENSDISAPLAWSYFAIDPANNSRLCAALYDSNANIVYAGRADGTIHRKVGAAYSSNAAGTGAINAFAADMNGAWAVGEKGAIYRIDRTGATQRIENAVNPALITDMAGPVNGKFYAVTTDGAIGYSNGGDVWFFSSNTNTGGKRLNAIRAFDDGLTVIAVGEGVIVRSTDGGASWVSIPCSGVLYGVDFIDNNRAVAAGKDGALLLLKGNSTPLVKTIAGVNVGLNGVSFEGNTGFIAGDKGTLLKTQNGGNDWEILSAPNGEDWTVYTDPLAKKQVDLNAISAIDQRTVYAAGDAGLVMLSTDGGDTWQRKGSQTAQDLTAISLTGKTVVMNGPNATVRAISNDSCRFSARFFYDRMGRLAASQNSKQRSMMPPRYSYVSYDRLGRVIETGEIAPNEQRELSQQRIDSDPNFPDGWSGNRFQVTRTRYDAPLDNMESELNERFTGNSQENLRNRIAAVAYYENLSSGNYNHATHFSYDIHGNVRELVQENTELKNTGQQYKSVVYEYDLISGNVNQICYQKGEVDQLYHKYEYDADNRIQRVSTSTDGLVWDNDATYQYYRHGPLARVEIGDLKVQGIDYAYTLQGWIKAVNSNILDPNNDMGKDGNNNFAKDAFGYSLHYNTNDYTPIGGSGSENFLSGVTSGTPVNNLYNGNISRMATAISENVSQAQNLNLGTQVRDFRYDQLNRLIASNKVSGKGADNAYATTYSYDYNGNFKTLGRKDGNGLLMDNLTYHYAKDGKGNILNNRLLHVNDDASESNETSDLKDQGTFIPNNPASHNYKFDKVGNLVADKQEEIEEIVWNAQGKLQAIKRTPNSSKPDLLFKYDAMGNRVSKTVIYPNITGNAMPKEVTTYYNLDAQGNVMATYENKRYNDGTEELYLKEQHLYGTERIGMRKTNLLLAKTDENVEFDLTQSSRVLGEKNFELTNHLGNVLAVVSDKKLADNEPDVVSTSDYYPFGMQMPGRFSYDPSNSYRYGFGGHEKIDENSGTGNSVDMGDRWLDVRLGRTSKPDKKATEYPNLSPYSYAANNPLSFIDPDGEKLKVADNITGSAENIARIAATNRGSVVINSLIQSPNTYTLNTVILQINSIYIPETKKISYCATPWTEELYQDKGAVSSMTLMGHELYHAYQHNSELELGRKYYNQIDMFASTYMKRLEELEPPAVSFENYLRQVYSMSPLRNKYAYFTGNFHQFGKEGNTEKISNFKTLGNNADKSSFGFSYTKTIEEGYYKTTNFGLLYETSTFIKTGETTQNYYMIVTMDKDKNATYKTYDNEKDYKEATKNW